MAGDVGQRGQQAVVQKARTHRRDGAVEDRQERAVALAVAQSAGQFQAAAGDFIECQQRIGAVRLELADVGQARLERFLQVDERPPRRQ